MQTQPFDLNSIANYMATLDSITTNQNTVSICFYGPTGSAKSTFINYLLGNQMKYTKARGNFMIQKEDSSAYGPTIENSAKSGTSCPEKYHWQNQLYLLDCPGTRDSRGPSVQICNSIGISRFVTVGSKIKFVLTLSVFDLEDGRGNIFMSRHFKPFFEMIRSDFTEMRNSLYFCITKVGTNYQRQDILSMVTDMIKTHTSTFPEQVYRILSDAVASEKVFIFYRPDHPEFQNSLNNMRQGLSTPDFMVINNQPRISLTSEAESCLTETENQCKDSFKTVTKKCIQSINEKASENMLKKDEILLKSSLNHLNNVLEQLREQQSYKLNDLIQVNSKIVPLDNALIQNFKETLEKVRMISQITRKSIETYTLKRSVIQTISTYKVNLNNHINKIENQKLVQKLKREEQERKRKEQEKRKKFLQELKRQEEQREKIRQEQIRRQQERIQRELEQNAKREQQEKERLLRQLERQKAENERRAREEAQRRKKEIPIQKKVERQTKRVVKQVSNVLKKIRF